MAYNRPQYNTYPKRTMQVLQQIVKVEVQNCFPQKDGCILVIELDNQNLVLKGFGTIS